MPSGQTHEVINKAATGLTVSVLLVDFQAGFGLVGGLWLSVYITPDLTCTEDTLPEYRLRQLGFPGQFLAWTFDVISSRIPHRHWLSHSPVGTLLRMAVLSPAVLLVWIIFSHKVFWFFVLGWIIGDLIHVGLDYLVSSIKREIRRIQRSRTDIRFRNQSEESKKAPTD